MRSTALTTVPSTGTTPIDIDVGQQNVSAVVIHNASYRVLTLTLSDGTSRMIGAQRSDVAYVRGGAFDGHVTLTPGTLVSAQTNAGSMWLDVYLSGEQVQGTYPAPCQNGMTAGNQQPRVQVVPIAAFFNSFAVVSMTSVSGDLACFLANMSYPADGAAISYFFSCDITYQCTNAVATDLFSIQVTLQLRPVSGGGVDVGSPIQVRSWYVSFTGIGGPPVPFAWPNPLAVPIGNSNGAAASYIVEANVHWSAGAAGKTINVLVSLQHDQDRQHFAAVPAEGGGFGGGLGFPGQDQYLGFVY